jgi:hypothetical protein
LAGAFFFAGAFLADAFFFAGAFFLAVTTPFPVDYDQLSGPRED